MDPHELPANQQRAGKLPSQIIKELQAENSQEENNNKSSNIIPNNLNSDN